AKMSRPPMPRGLLERPRLDEWFQRLGDVRLAVLHAPSGFGKTTLACQWAQAFDGRVAWLQLHPGDNDPRQLGRYLLHVIDAQLAHGCARSLLLAEQGGEVFDTLLTHLLAELPAEHDPLLLVLDDFETLNNPEVIA